MPADGAILGASIRTLDDSRPAATALAWRDGVLVAVGDDAEVREHVGAGTRVIDGRGMAVVPGLTDSHIHPFWGTRVTRGIDLRPAATFEEVRARLAAAPGGGWVLAHSARYEAFDETGLRADAIAQAVGDRPAVIYFFDGHTALASHTALALAGIRGDRTFGESAAIVVDADGRPTGALLENAAMDLVNAVVPKWTEAERLDAYATTLRTLNSVGLTGAHVMIGTPELLDDVRALEERGELSLRMVVPMHQEPAITDEEVERRLAVAGERGRLWRAGTAKFFLDGVLESGTAWLLEPGRRARTRTPFWPSVARYSEAGAALHRGGLQRDHARGRRRRGARGAGRLRGGRPAGARDAPDRAHRDAGRRRPVRASRRWVSRPRCSRCTWKGSTFFDAERVGAWTVRRARRARVPLGRHRRLGVRCSRSARTGWSRTTTRASGWPGRGCGALPASPSACRSDRGRR